MAERKVRGLTPLIAIGLSAAILSAMFAFVGVFMGIASTERPSWISGGLEELAQSPPTSLTAPSVPKQSLDLSDSLITPSAAIEDLSPSMVLARFGAAFVEGTKWSLPKLDDYYSLPSGPVSSPLSSEQLRKLVGIGSSCSLERTWAYPNQSQVRQAGPALFEVTIPLNCSDSQRNVTLRVDVEPLERKTDATERLAPKTALGIRGVLLPEIPA